jgi:hypothetical protein
MNRDEPIATLVPVEAHKTQVTVNPNNITKLENPAGLSDNDSDCMPSVRNRVANIDLVTHKASDNVIEPRRPIEPCSDQAFISILRLTKFPFIPQYIPKQYSEDVAVKFFNQQKFWSCSWDL